MRYFLILSIAFWVSIATISCSKSNDATPTAPVAIDSTFDVTKATLLKQGSFAGSGGHIVNGIVKLYDYTGKKYIYFENFSATNGPDLKVYLATNLAASQFISLGSLKGVTGNQAYLIATPPDFTQYNKILIWCQQFTVLFGSAALQ
jgi:Electron transfer DM13